MNKLLPFFFVLLWLSSQAQQIDTFRIVKQKETAKTFEAPFVSFGGRRGGDISSSEAKNSCCLIINRPDFRVVSFDLTIQGAGDLTTYKSINNMLTSEMIKALGKLKPGMLFTLEEIRAYGYDGIPRKMAPLYFKITTEASGVH